MLRAQKFEEAEQLARGSPNSRAEFEAELLLADESLALGDLERCANYLNRAREWGIRRHEVLPCEAKLCNALGQIERAHECLDELLAIIPESSFALEMKTMMARAARDRAAHEKWLARWFVANPFWPQSGILFRLRLRQGKLGEAAAVFRRSMAAFAAYNMTTDRILAEARRFYPG